MDLKANQDSIFEFSAIQPDRSCFYWCLIDVENKSLDENDNWKVLYWNNETKKWKSPYNVLMWTKYPGTILR